MKKYLNREETNDILLLLDMGGRIRDVAPCMRKTPEERLSCPGRDIFFGLGIPMCDENAPEGVCPWDCGDGGIRNEQNL